MAIGLKDIAEDMNVSVSLVSKILSGRLGTSGASSQLIKAVHRRASELGYRRNRTAAALSSGRHGVIGVFIHRVGARGSGVVEELLRGIAHGADRFNQRLWLTFFETDEEFMRMRSEIHPGSIDGLVFGGVGHGEMIPDLLKFHHSGLPVITLHAEPGHAELVNVGVDQEQLTRISTNHLLDRGCRRLALVDADRLRTAGFRKAMAERGMIPDERLIFRGNFEYETGEAAAKAWLAAGVPFDGVVAESDQQALGVLHVLLRNGLRVPQDVRIIGIDNSAAAETSIVKLTSVSERYSERGEMAVRLLTQMIVGKEMKSIVIEPQLHLRESS